MNIPNLFALIGTCLLSVGIAVADNIPTQSSEVDLIPTEGNAKHTTYFLLEISNALSVDASVDYVTQDGTAIAGQDYVATSGTATIKAGELSTVIGVEIIGDVINENDETFDIVISNPQGAKFPSGTNEIIASKTIVDDDPNYDLITQVDFEELADEQEFSQSSWDSEDYSVPWTNGFNQGRAHIDTAFSYYGDSSLRITFPSGEGGTDKSGAQAPLIFTSGQEIYVSYWFRMSDNFDWGGIFEGGKLPGLASGDRCSGGSDCIGTNGFSARLMWRSGGKAVLYLYHMDKPDGDGEDFNLTDSNGDNLYFQQGVWYNVVQRVKMNTGDNKDGEVQVWINGVEAVNLTGIQFVNDGSLIDTFYFSTFHGGPDYKWGPDETCYIWFDDINIYKVSN